MEQLDRALEGKRAWMSGIRRADGDSRAGMGQFEIDRRGLVKVNPLVAWTDDEVLAYEIERDIIINPSATRATPPSAAAPAPPRSTTPMAPTPAPARWTGLGRTECGLHL